MKLLLVLISLLLSVEVFAATSFTMICNGKDFSGERLTLKMSSSRVSTSFHQFDRSALKITRDQDSAILLDLSGTNQRWFHETEQGLTSFGIFDNSVFRDRTQTVYIQMAYDNIGFLETMRQAEIGVLSAEDLKQWDVTFQTFGETDRRALSLHFKCDITLAK